MPHVLERTPTGQFKKGHGFWTGKKRPPFSDEWKAKVTGNLIPVKPGQKPSAETRRKMSAAKKGKTSCVLGKRWKLSEEFKAKARSRVGPASSGWRGGRTPALKAARNTVGYQEWRTAVFVRDGYRCTKCGAKGELHADHIKRFADFPELRFDVSNGRTLCVPCHRATDTYGTKGRRKHDAARDA